MIFSSCMNIAWKGYKNPIESDFITVNTNESCMKIGKQNLNKRQTKAIIEAASDVCNIFHSKEFKQTITSQNWLASCELLNGHPDEMSGEHVYKLLIQNIQKYSINPHRPWRAIAQTQRDETNFVYNRVAIKPIRIEAWYSTVDSVKSELVNTIAHETTHIISEKFLDAGHGNNCPNERLVSYSIGNIVEKIWLSNHRQ